MIYNYLKFNYSVCLVGPRGGERLCGEKLQFFALTVFLFNFKFDTNIAFGKRKNQLHLQLASFLVAGTGLEPVTFGL